MLKREETAGLLDSLLKKTKWF